MSPFLPFAFRSAGAAGFTLVELLAAMVVLAILGVIIAQAIQASSNVLSKSNKDSDAYAEMRQALDRITVDLSARINRKDVPAYYVKQNGNDKFTFYSSVPSTLPAATSRGIAELFYRVVTPNGTNPSGLERAAEGLAYSGANVLPFVDTAAALTAPSDPTNADYDVLSQGVFRMEISYVSATVIDQNTGNILSLGGKLLNTFPATSGDTYTNMGALCVTVAALDPESRKLLTNANAQITSLAAALPDAQDNISTYSTWMGIVDNSPTLATTAGIPPAVAARVRIMERRIPLN